MTIKATTVRLCQKKKNAAAGRLPTHTELSKFEFASKSEPMPKEP